MEIDGATAPTPEEKVIYIHGFSKKELFALVDLIKKNVSDPRSIAFATSTKNNIEMKIKDMIREVRSDHAYMEERRAALKEGRPVPPAPQN